MIFRTNNWSCLFSLPKKAEPKSLGLCLKVLKRKLSDSGRMEYGTWKRVQFGVLVKECGWFFRKKFDRSCFKRSDHLEIGVPDIFLQFERHFWNRLIFLFFLFQFLQLFCQITFTVTMKHRFFLIDTVFGSEFDLVVVKPNVPWECCNILPKQGYYENDTQYARSSLQMVVSKSKGKLLDLLRS